MDAIKLIHDTAGQTLTIWLDDPRKESVGVEILHFRPASGSARVTLETLSQASR